MRGRCQPLAAMPIRWPWLSARTPKLVPGTRCSGWMMRPPSRSAATSVAATLARAEELGGQIVQPAQQVPGTSFGVFADAQGHKIGVAANG